jgi:hypothetical protein
MLLINYFKQKLLYNTPPWKLLENFSTQAKGEIPSEAGNTNFTNWLSILNKIRTFFKENPDAEF